jgi:HPt (histidine-containing phosphotransfer) domain-containing protein
MQQLQSALQVNDLQTAACTSHKFASSAANVGAPAFAQAVRELERSCTAGETARCKDIFEQLRAAYPVLVEELRGHRLPASA